MKVVYDISTFGSVRKHPRARTGVYRVTERVARGLLASGDCELVFSATESIYAFIHAREHLASHAVLRNVPILAPSAGTGVVNTLSSLLDGLSQKESRGLPSQSLHKLLFRGMRLLERGLHRPNVGEALGVDIFHSPFGALPAARDGARSPKRFLTVYDLITVRFPQFFDKGLVRIMDAVYQSLELDDWALAISEVTKADLCEYRGVDPARVFVTHLAADPELFHPCPDPEQRAVVRRRYGIPEGPYVLSLNTLEPRKNLDHLVRAFVRLLQQEHLRDLSLVLVGAQGWKYEKVFEAIAEAGPVRERILLTGYVADEDLAALYSGALAFVYPSLYEGFGLPPLEAMQCGTPVITSNTSSLPEVVGDAGILLDPRDTDGLCQSLLELYRSESLRAEMRHRSLVRAQRFSWHRCIAQTLAAYRTVLAN